VNRCDEVLWFLYLYLSDGNGVMNM